MKLSTKGRYGVRMMIDLAAHYGEGPVLLREVAKRQEISEKYLSNLINPLKATGLVEATRGVHGGYVLGKAPTEITMKEIIEVLEGPLCLVDCVEKPAVCNRTPFCIASDLWSEAAEGMSKVLGKYTLADMVIRQKAKRDNLTHDNYMI
ncbi:MAG: AsnC family transcriptional regulator [Syntrophobacterales bacterium CG_4_8_14_3_um_filter_58_8]|nr:MAG: AsnC family transcriptional regulator [Syntrophobacterales bacterium CG03_land_8_20_14_0_80_58_14]PJC72198.1 MAG: AsnC family transcriptional regulator [Syntrophobacterales bacterium CG_4_8_14_3_um_filter_58_8]